MEQGRGRVNGTIAARASESTGEGEGEGGAWSFQELLRQRGGGAKPKEAPHSGGLARRVSSPYSRVFSWTP